MKMLLNYFNYFFWILPIKKTKLIILIILFIVMSLIEALSIGIIGPFLNLANHPHIINNNKWLNFINTHLELNSPEKLVALLGFFIIFLFFLKSFFIWQVRNYIFSVCLNVRQLLCKRLLQEYMQAPYIFHLSKDSAYIIQVLSNYTRLFSLEILLPILTTASNVITIIVLSILLFITSKLVIIGLLLMFLPSFLLLYVFQGKIRAWGKQMSESDESIIRTINHSIGGIKETKVIGCSHFFEGQLSHHVDEFAKNAGMIYSVQILPRILVEAILMFCLIGTASIFLVVKNSFEEVIPVLSIFAFSSIRLLPAISNSSKTVNKLRSMTHVLERLNYDLTTIAKNKNCETLIKEPLGKCWSDQSIKPSIFDKNKNNRSYIVLQGISYQYPESSHKSICNISLSIEKGKSIAFIGQSGAGKTTLADIILGLLIPQTGDIKVNNISIYQNLRGWQDKIGYIPQSIFLTSDTIERNIAFGVPNHLIDQQRLTKALEAAQLKEMVQDLPKGLQTLVGERGMRLSGGQRQRIGIARALYHERDILVLDEATSALDNETESLVTESIQSLSGIKTMILIAHRLTTIKHCDCVYVMEKGQIIKSGSYEEVVLDDMYSR